MMDPPTLTELEETAKSIVWKARQEGSLSSLTVRIIRGKVEAQYGLDAGTLDAKEYKAPLKKAVKEATEKAIPPDVVSKGISSRKNANSSEPSNKTTTKTSLGKKRQHVESKREYKSAATIFSSDIEDEINPESKTSDPKSGISLRSKEGDPVNVNQINVEKRQKIKSSDSRTVYDSPIVGGKVADDNDSAKSLSGDESKQRKRQKRETTRKSSKGKHEAKQKVNGELNKDEAAIKRLKSFVIACGVRKPWAKVFQDCDSPSQQIKKLKEILADLGMTGRYSLEQAKRIKGKRELAKELEDVQSFEQSIAQRERKASTTEHESEEEREEDIGPRKRKRTALQSIAAFLDSQSEEE